MERLGRYLIFPLFLSVGVAAETGRQLEQSLETSAFPPGMIALFAGSSCPDGWTNEPLTQGRIAMGAATPAESGDVVGEPFVDKKTRPHAHEYKLAAEIPGDFMSIWCCFSFNWVTPQTVEWTGSTAERDSDLPFHAMRMCRRSEQP